MNKFDQEFVTMGLEVQEVPVAVDIEMMLNDLGSKSAVIRKLHNDGMKRSEIAKVLNIRYQHVRNVLTQPLKRQASL